jgi:hypothetical protein
MKTKTFFIKEIEPENVEAEIQLFQNREFITKIKLEPVVKEIGGGMFHYSYDIIITQTPQIAYGFLGIPVLSKILSPIKPYHYKFITGISKEELEEEFAKYGTDKRFLTFFPFQRKGKYDLLVRYMPK